MWSREMGTEEVQLQDDDPCDALLVASGRHVDVFLLPACWDRPGTDSPFPIPSTARRRRVPAALLIGNRQLLTSRPLHAFVRAATIVERIVSGSPRDLAATSAFPTDSAVCSASEAASGCTSYATWCDLLACLSNASRVAHHRQKAERLLSILEQRLGEKALRGLPSFSGDDVTSEVLAAWDAFREAGISYQFAGECDEEENSLVAAFHELIESLNSPFSESAITSGIGSISQLREAMAACLSASPYVGVQRPLLASLRLALLTRGLGVDVEEAKTSEAQDLLNVLAALPSDPPADGAERVLWCLHSRSEPRVPLCTYSDRHLENVSSTKKELESPLAVRAKAWLRARGVQTSAVKPVADMPQPALQCRPQMHRSCSSPALSARADTTPSRLNSVRTDSSVKGTAVERSYSSRAAAAAVSASTTISTTASTRQREAMADRLRARAVANGDQPSVTNAAVKAARRRASSSRARWNEDRSRSASSSGAAVRADLFRRRDARVQRFIESQCADSKAAASIFSESVSTVDLSFLEAEVDAMADGLDVCDGLALSEWNCAPAPPPQPSPIPVRCVD